MRILSTATLGWLGGLAAGVAAILSLTASDADDVTPEGGNRVTDARPASFLAGDRGAPGWSPDQRQSGAVPDGPSQTDSYPSSHGKKGASDQGRGSDLSGQASLFSFSGQETQLPTLPVNHAFPQGAPADSFNLQPSVAQTGYFLANVTPFPSFPPGSPGVGPTTPRSGTDSPPSYYVVLNGGNEGGQPNGLNDGDEIWYIGVAYAVPEPSSWALGILALGAVIVLRRRTVLA